MGSKGAVTWGKEAGARARGRLREGWPAVVRGGLLDYKIQYGIEAGARDGRGQEKVGEQLVLFRLAIIRSNDFI